MKLRDIAQLVGVERFDPAIAEIEPSGFSIDSRTIRAGELFFAIKGASLDGHDYVAQALRKGACAAIVSREVESAPTGQLIFVADTLVALQALAQELRNRWNGTVIGVTGSSGKTATKELTAEMIAAGGASVIRTTGNYNNAYGLPLSFLQVISNGASPEQFQYAVLEMGMSAPGEITELCSITQPNVGIVTNVSAVHLEFFPSVEAIAEAKAELVDCLKADGLAVLNADDPLVARMRRRQPVAVRTFGIEAEADVTAKDVKPLGVEGTSFRLVTPRGEIAAKTRLLGRHQVANILAAAAVADHFQVPLEAIANTIADAKPYKMRGEITRFPQGFVIVDDSYNSNPRALGEMVKTVFNMNGFARRIVVAGEMLELGERGAELHRQSGRAMAEAGVSFLIGVRGLAREMVDGAREGGLKDECSLYCETPDEAARWLFDNLRSGDLVLVKGSRGVKLDQVVHAVKRRFIGETN
jgi:UDP-N-acetylmuramoyl-tripeptide--D-alanyl-D-alanine ligase